MPVGTFQNRLVVAASAKCTTAPIEIMSIPKMPDVLQAVRTGRADATVNGYATSVYTTEKQTGKGVGLQALPDVRLAVGYLGMLVSKDNPELRDTGCVASLQHMVDSGAYQAIMEKWSLGPLAVKTVKFNDAALDAGGLSHVFRPTVSQHANGSSDRQDSSVRAARDWCRRDHRAGSHASGHWAESKRSME